MMIPAAAPSHSLSTADRPPRPGRGSTWAGRILSGLASLFFLVDGGMKLVAPPPVVEATVALGYAESAIFGIGVTLLACTLIYLIPRTAVVGAIVLTGYLGGAVASHLRAGGGIFEMLFPVAFGAMVWTGLALRNERVRGLLTDPSRGPSTGGVGDAAR